MTTRPRALPLLVALLAAASCRSAPVASSCPPRVEVPTSGSYCGVAVTITPWARADAYWEGATFQSDEGHGQSRDVTVSFAAPVASVEVTAYDPTYRGNEMRAYDAKGRLVGRVEFPGNGQPGDLTTQTRTIAGRISRVELVAAKGDYVNYSMRVTVGR